MSRSPRRLLVVSTAVGTLGSGKGGGVEVTLAGLVAGLIDRGHSLTVLAAEGSKLPPGCEAATLWSQPGVDQPSWQHQPRQGGVQLPAGSLLAGLWETALNRQGDFDAILNLGYDWLPFWLTRHLATPLFHLVSMGSVATVMDEVITAVDRWNPGRLAFHSAAQAGDFRLGRPAKVVGNGFDLASYVFRPRADPEAGLGWAGRIAPEKGLEDAAAVAAQLGRRLSVWGLRADPAYALAVEASVPAGTIDWRGFLPSERLQAELGGCAVLLNTPKWNEAYGNVVVEAMACGVPVVAYRRGGPAELVQSGLTGMLVPPDDGEAMAGAVAAAEQLNRYDCRRWVEQHCSREAFAARIEAWLSEGL
ncbi:glycosyltransferase [Synechococcus sp. CS-602]|uniref:glycosyltransferase n=1 Tax=Synechococcaceae TaxID=1890426 RepID=UPI0008FF3FFD|nr:MULTISPECIES: glycosyltransferase [Synechococcaceae]MCT4365566.1 glycosyltransferase [Candidatus Regnicoccus frigidus MAG-AL1]APD47433.1 glycosyl transferase [Synechococcus sp. SynAce01]MCT0202632.1 glycosyltransferase [Synechococcus sp. CS-603]MCT0204436.1 glycosyltransferase [Synechococcus sp. CS-602]MCT0247278.1 glycosyltransferase [Synechococcus sp. CS-601]